MYMYIQDGYFAKIPRQLHGITYRIKIMLKGLPIVKQTDRQYRGIIATNADVYYFLNLFFFFKFRNLKFLKFETWNLGTVIWVSLCDTMIL